MQPHVYTTRLFDLDHRDPLWATLWTVPEGSVWILRSLIITSVHTAAQTIYVSFNTGTPPHQIYLASGVLQPNETKAFDTRQELLPGEVISAFTELGRATFLATGYQFAS